jgi:hypothetical protein
MRRVHYRSMESACGRKLLPNRTPQRNMGVAVATAVIIPARNEEKTVGPIVRAFQRHAETNGTVFVGVDAMTSDNTAARAKGQGALIVDCSNIHGKGEVVSHVVGAMRLLGIVTRRIILCDADYTGFTARHVGAILAERRGMVIGVPDLPDLDEIPDHVEHAWPLVSGFRCLPEGLVPFNAHGYLLETQLNQAAHRQGEVIRMIPMPGLKSPFRWPLSPRRIEALQRDRKWGQEHGVF